MADSILFGVLCGGAAVLGHMFPFYTGFKGGKEVANFGGMVLAVDIRIFILLAVAGFLIAVIINRGCALPFFAAGAFLVIYAARTQSLIIFLVLSFVSICMIGKHVDNVRKIRWGEETPVRLF